MKYLLFALLLLGVAHSAKVVRVDERYQNSQKCQICHKRIVDEWRGSWHAKSHFAKDEYFAKSIEYVSRKTHKSLNALKVQCATCHNPRISVTSTDVDYEIAVVMGLNDGSEVDKAVNDVAISEGINCVVCHNIDKIHDEYDETKRGINRVEWTPSDTMTGPYEDAKSPYHKTIHHDFMDKTPNRLCFVCHANDRSVKGLVFTNMEKEYKSDKACVSCHMGPRKKDVAATFRFNGKAKMRNVRNHNFYGAHVQKMWHGALQLRLAQKNGALQIAIRNPQPHNIPSGFGGRELIVDIVYKNLDGAAISKKSISLTTHYTRRRSKPSIPHTAKKQSKDASIPALGQRVFRVKKPKGAASVEVELSYRLVNDEIRNLLKLKDPLWSKKFPITKGVLSL